MRPTQSDRKCLSNWILTLSNLTDAVCLIANYGFRLVLKIAMRLIVRAHWAR